MFSVSVCRTTTDDLSMRNKTMKGKKIFGCTKIRYSFTRVLYQDRDHVLDYSTTVEPKRIS